MSIPDVQPSPLPFDPERATRPGRSPRERQRLVDRAVAALYRWYVSRSQTRRNWNPDTSFRWKDVSRRHSPEFLAMVQGFFAVEQFIPDYTGRLVSLVRRDYGRSQFYLRWGAEEAKHSDLWRNTLLATGHRDLEWTENYTRELRDRAWELPFDDPLEMLLYTVFQERATYLNYANLQAIAEGQSDKPWLADDADPVLVEAARTIAADEVAHYEFYLAVAQVHLYYFPEQTLRALAHVLAHFEMPAARIVPDYGQFIDALHRCGVFGRRAYVTHVVRVVSEQFGVRDFAALDQRIKQARTLDPSDATWSRSDSTALVDPSIVRHSLLRLFHRVEAFEAEHGIAELFQTRFEPFDWERDDVG